VQVLLWQFQQMQTAPSRKGMKNETVSFSPLRCILDWWRARLRPTMLSWAWWSARLL